MMTVAVTLLSANLLFMAALSFGSESAAAAAPPAQQQEQERQRHNLRRRSLMMIDIGNNNNPSSYYYSQFSNHQSQRTLYHKTILDGAVRTVGAKRDAQTTSSSPHTTQPYEWTKEIIDCPTPLHSSIPQYFGECFLLINVASGARLYAETFSTTGTAGVGSVQSTDTNIQDNQIWLNEYPLDLQQKEDGSTPDLVTIRNAASGRRLYATNTEGDDLSVGFGASKPTQDNPPPNANEIWEERVQYKYSNVIRG